MKLKHLTKISKVKGKKATKDQKAEKPKFPEQAIMDRVNLLSSIINDLGFQANGDTEVVKRYPELFDE